ncbi:MAG: hypothetical protein V1659_01050 [Candidatus Woesearchaeota archaeon]
MNKRISSLNILLAFAAGFLTHPVCDSACKERAYRIDPVAFCDIDGDGKSEAFEIATSGMASSLFQKLAYFSGNKVFQDSTGAYWAFGFPKEVPTVFFTRENRDSSISVGPRLYLVGELDGQPGIDISVRDCIDYPVAIGETFSGVFPEPKNQKPETGE